MFLQNLSQFHKIRKLACRSMDALMDGWDAAPRRANSHFV